jgi:DNA-binding transcriptional MerR regulator
MATNRAEGSRRRAEPGEATFPVRAAARLTGVSPDLLRAWERRYRVVEPLRSPGGTRRYRAADLERLRLVKAAVDAGHRIGEVAPLAQAELERRAAQPRAREPGPIEAALAALARLDAGEAERLVSLQLAALGPTRFAREFALPLLVEIGAGWASSRVCAASEHLGTALLRSLLGAALRPTRASQSGPRIVFATPSGERHELGLLAAAIAAIGAGGNAIYLGPDLPVEELVGAVATSGAAALAIGLVALPAAEAERAVRRLREGLDEGVELWLGGPRSAEVALPPRVRRLDSLEAIERGVALLGLRGGLPSRP